MGMRARKLVLRTGTLVQKLFAGAVLALVLAVAHPAFAVEPDEILKDPALEKRARALSAELRCVVCQNQSIDDSNAPLARDLRLLVRERLRAGDSNDEVLDFVVARYGEFVLLKPPFGWHTLALWGAPFLVLLGGIWLARTTVMSRRLAEPKAVTQQEKPLSADEQAQLERLMARDAEAPPKQA